MANPFLFCLLDSIWLMSVSNPLINPFSHPNAPKSIDLIHWRLFFYIRQSLPALYGLFLAWQFFPILYWRDKSILWKREVSPARMYTCVDHEGAECHMDQIGSKRNCALRWDSERFLKVWDGCARMIVGSNWFQPFLAPIAKVLLLCRSLCENCIPVAIKSVCYILSSMVWT